MRPTPMEEKVGENSTGKGDETKGRKETKAAEIYRSLDNLPCQESSPRHHRRLDTAVGAQTGGPTRAQACQKAIILGMIRAGVTCGGGGSHGMCDRGLILHNMHALN